MGMTTNTSSGSSCDLLNARSFHVKSISSLSTPPQDRSRDDPPSPPPQPPPSPAHWNRLVPLDALVPLDI
ncbi:hypothetical protein Ptr902_02190 [Pyrenophora tritici-repentis]|uniref:Uncharacterized protein n=1 Tax=Pyrenophora tritici-repentis TaxID=45151 RepID=A0A2W1EML5_9PLEO|nr:hypothetical protein Alg130_01015 [Pyrenophora tritici-repentis]KAI0614324.1 hypothetical protein TUN205_01403 [Pyrenophora tritici-repentis]KAI1511651.1 hypothetical protein Ptr86124_009295 [Pyrenophora tritici-repentis]KAI1544728.1 hypothetical protein PtrSN001C_003434 [Pyrenophora tritici-repentis]KAI1604347.1 hypothetical protein PtrCC142_003474 [Pyrenophora tritici-repentis]